MLLKLPSFLRNFRCTCAVGHFTRTHKSTEPIACANVTRSPLVRSPGFAVPIAFVRGLRQCCPPVASADGKNPHPETRLNIARAQMATMDHGPSTMYARPAAVESVQREGSSRTHTRTEIQSRTCIVFGMRPKRRPNRYTQCRGHTMRPPFERRPQRPTDCEHWGTGTKSKHNKEYATDANENGVQCFAIIRRVFGVATGQISHINNCARCVTCNACVLTV